MSPLHGNAWLYSLCNKMCVHCNSDHEVCELYVICSYVLKLYEVYSVYSDHEVCEL